MKARKRFGQHFLEPVWVAKLVAALQPAPGDHFIEIGPGRGALTLPLATKVADIVAIEIDRDLAAWLAQRAPANVRVVTGDVLEMDFVAAARTDEGADRRRLRVVGNLPYYISSPILFRLLEASTSGVLLDATLMLQKEVADRLVAKPGTSEYGVLALQAALFADVTRLLSLPAGAFRPAPRVQSAVVRLSFRPPPPAVHDPRLVTAIVRSVFTQRRKTLGNALAPFAATRGRTAQDALKLAGIDAGLRPQSLQLADLARLADAFTADGPTKIEPPDDGIAG
jgi:16S rRNA (adenine1518-N6/adenine1519-N6)-dimethyltransferase